METLLAFAALATITSALIAIGEAVWKVWRLRQKNRKRRR